MSLERCARHWVAVGRLVPRHSAHGTLLAGRCASTIQRGGLLSPWRPAGRRLSTSAPAGVAPEALQALAKSIAADGVLAQKLAAEPSAVELLGAARRAGLLPRAAAGAPSVAEPEAAVCAADTLEREPPPAPTAWQMRVYALQNLIPFIGFGFFDNFMMILAGDFIDAKLGVAFGFTTMAAAAVGNTISDVVGLWVSGFVEAFAAALGLPDHGLTNAQRRTVQIRVLKNCSMVVGLVIGCIIGMFPLAYPTDWRLWPSRSEQEERAKSDEPVG
uniref:Transmembrane protein 65 n=1 Tax=Alexandrium monilatum TaxID=311494 RepID=A0A7S4Q6L7_9DINO|mmetsp:Transcript_81639/g.243442  ORF Transcript_81639/g.243442 Transcript_81639/m.243442 type:complete len:273 (+) Transcript_81639:57-875(+)